MTSERLPIVLFKHVDNMDVVIDKTHPVFVVCGMSPVEIIASEVASYIYDFHRPLAGNPGHTVSNIAWQIIRKYWFDKVEISEDNITRRCNELLSSIKDQISTVIDESLSDRFFNEMDESQQKLFVNEILKNNIPLSRIPNLKANGTFVTYVPNEFLLHILEESPELFFNGNYWEVGYGEMIDGFSISVIEEMDNCTLVNYRNALETIVLFVSNKSNGIIELKRVEAALNFLNDKRSKDVL